MSRHNIVGTAWESSYHSPLQQQRWSCRLGERPVWESEVAVAAVRGGSCGGVKRWEKRLHRLPHRRTARKSDLNGDWLPSQGLWRRVKCIAMHTGTSSLVEISNSAPTFTYPSAPRRVISASTVATPTQRALLPTTRQVAHRRNSVDAPPDEIDSVESSGRGSSMHLDKGDCGAPETSIGQRHRPAGCTADLR